LVGLAWPVYVLIIAACAGLAESKYDVRSIVELMEDWVVILSVNQVAEFKM
jgi:hypothetical protein